MFVVNVPNQNRKELPLERKTKTMKNNNDKEGKRFFVFCDWYHFRSYIFFLDPTLEQKADISILRDGSAKFQDVRNKSYQIYAIVFYGKSRNFTPRNCDVIVYKKNCLLTLITESQVKIWIIAESIAAIVKSSL